MSKKWKRILAAVLAASMIFGNSAPAYAAEIQSVVETVQTEDENAVDESILFDSEDQVDDDSAAEEQEEGVDSEAEVENSETEETEAEAENPETGEIEAEVETELEIANPEAEAENSEEVTEAEAEIEPGSDTIESMESDSSNEGIETMDSSYVVDTSCGYEITDVTVEPSSYYAKMKFETEEDLDYNTKIIYTTDSELADDFYPGVTSVYEEDLDDAGYKISSLDYAEDDWKDYIYHNEGIFSAQNDGLMPNTTYYYRVAYCEYQSYPINDYEYFFLTEPLEFKTSKALENTQVTIKDVNIEYGYTGFDVTFAVDNPSAEFILNTYITYGDEKIYADYVYDDNDDIIPGLYEAKGYFYGNEVVVKAHCDVYVGEKEIYTIESSEFEIGPKKFQEDSVDVAVTAGAATLNAEIKVSPFYKCDGLSFQLYYREKGSEEWFEGSCMVMPSDGCGIYEESSQSCFVNEILAYELNDETVYEYYWEIGDYWRDDNYDYVFHAFAANGSEDNPLEFSTEKIITYEDELFPDDAFRNLLKNQAGISSTEKLTNVVLDTVTWLEEYGAKDIASIEGIQYCKNLRNIYFISGGITDITQIARLTLLESADFYGNNITQMPDLSNLKNLTYLDLNYNMIESASITADKLPKEFLEYDDNSDWIRITKGNQRKPFGVILADTYYAIGETHPFLVQLNGILEGEFTISVSTAKGTKASTEYCYDGGVVAIEDLGNIVEIGSQKIELTITDEDGEVWLDKAEYTVAFAEDELVAEDIYAQPNASWINAIVNVPGYIEEDEKVSLQLLNTDGKVLGMADYVSWHSESEEDRYNDVFEAAFIPLDREVTILEGDITLSKYLTSGDYSIKVIVGENNEEQYLFKDIVHVSNASVINYIDIDHDHDFVGDYIYLEMEGYSIDAAKVYPAVYDQESGQEISQFVNYKIVDDEKIIYKLKKVEQDSFWFPGESYLVKIKTEESYECIDNRNYKYIYIDEYAEVLFSCYNYKKEVYEAIFNDYIEDGSKIQVRVYPEWPYGDDDVQVIATAEGMLNGAKLSLKLTDSSDNPFIPERYEYYVFEYYYQDKEGDWQVITEDKYVKWYNYHSSSEDSVSEFIAEDWELYYKTGQKQIAAQAFVLAEKVGSSLVTAQLYNSDDEPVGSAVTMSRGEKVTFGENLYYDYKGTLEFTKGLTEGYYWIKIKNGGSESRIDVYVVDDSKFYMSNQYVGKSNELIYVELSSPLLGYQFYNQYDGSVSSKEALEIWKANYRLEVFDCFGEEITGWKYVTAEYYSDWMEVYISGLEDYVGCYFRITDAKGRLGTIFGENETYYSEGWNSSEELGEWGEIGHHGSSEVYLLDDYEAGGYYGVFVRDWDSLPVTVTVSLPYETDPIKTIKFTTGGGGFKNFTKNDLDGLSTDEVYQITAVASNGYAESEIGYIGYEERQDPIYEYSISHSELFFDLTSNKSAQTLSVSDGYKNIAAAWSSDDITVAKVSSTGVVTPVGVGTATITAVVNDEVSFTCAVTVKNDYIKSIALDVTALTMDVDEEKTFTVTYAPENSTLEKDVTWTSSDETVVVIDAEGNATAIGGGTATITATMFNGLMSGDVPQTVTASCKITVYQYSISSEELEFDIFLGGKETLTVSNGISNVTAVWSSSDESVVSVDKKGNVTPVGVGTATIKAEIKNGPTLECYVIVTNPHIETITLSHTEAVLLETDEGLQLEAYITPANTTLDKEINWTSSDEDIVTVDEDGYVTIIDSGTAVITAASSAAPEVKAECSITVMKEAWEVPEIPELSAITNVHKKLGDVELPEVDNGTLRWKNPEIQLAKFAGTQNKTFIAIYEEENAVPVEVEVEMSLITISKLTISGDRTTLVLDGLYRVELLAEWVAVGNTDVLEEYEIEWISKKPAVATVDEDGVVEAIAKGSTTIQATVVVGGKKYTASYNVKVVEGTSAYIFVEDIENFEREDGYNFTGDLADKTGVINVYAQDTASLTFTSSDPSVIKLKSSSAKLKDGMASIPFEMKAGGTAKISIKAKDALNTTEVIYLTVKDSKPSIDVTSLAINTLKDSKAVFHIYPASGFTVENPVLGGKDAAKFTLAQKENDEYELTVNEGTKAGSYKVEVVVTADGNDYKFPLTVKVSATKAKVTAKQAAKVNVFYNDKKGYGLLNLTSTEDITAAELVDCDFEVVSFDAENKTATIAAKEGVTSTKADKAGTLKVTLEGWSAPYEMKYTVGLENKAPKLALTAKTATFYPLMGIDKAETSLTMDGKDYNISETTQITMTDSKGKEISGYTWIVDPETEQLIVIAEATAKNATASVKIKEESWNAAVAVSYAFKINNKKPVAKLSAATVQLNAHDDTNGYDMKSVQVMWSDTTEFAPESIVVAAADKNAQNVLNKGIILSVEGDKIVARLNNQFVKAGSYKYKVYVTEGEYTAATTLTVKIVNVAAKKAVKLTSKGSIDVINRNGSSVVVTPKLTSVNGTITDVRLAGRDAHLFDSELLEDGTVQIKAKANEYARLITGYTYGVNIQLTIENEDGKTMEVQMDETKLTLKQGAAKVTATPSTSIFYTNTSESAVSLKLDATLKGADNPKIESVELTNLTNAFEYEYDEETQTITLTRVSGETAKGKTYSLKFNVKLEGHADTVKPIAVTYKVTVK